MPAAQVCQGGFACISSACKTACTTKADCQSGRFCGAGTCKPLVAVQVTGGQAFTCALLSDGTVRCWGDNGQKQLGDPAAGVVSAVPVTVVGLSGVVAIDAGDFHACAVLSDQTLRCWGVNSSGELGNGSVGADSPTPVAVNGLTNVLAVAGGYGRTCAVLTSGTVRCWGKLAGIAQGTPQAVPGLTSATAISVGINHMCAINAGAVSCWGDNKYGQLGADPALVTMSADPIAIPNLTASAISAGFNFTCALTASGQVRCWGSGTRGSLGNGSPPLDSFNPVTVANVSDAIAIGTGTHACELSSARTVRCWGGNSTGSVGADPAMAQFDTPAPVVPGISGVTSLGTGTNHTCVVVPDGAVRCWGYNAEGQLGLPPSTIPPYGTATPSNISNW
jgi:alpha-tubulin suppressor-like RCC1 family protein